MRISGLVSGMDIDSIVSDLMKAERMPLTRMHQDRQWLTWKRDAYREMNTLLSSFDQLFLDMKLSGTYETKSTTSSQENAVTASANTGVVQGSYSIEVTQLASQAINASSTGITKDGATFDPNAELSTQSANLKGGLETGSFTITTYDSDGNAIQTDVTVDGSKSLNQILSEITEADNGLRAFYDQTSDRVFFERTESGDHNVNGNEIIFSDEAAATGFFKSTLQIDATAEQGGKNARFTYNGIQLESKQNSYTINGLTLNFHGQTNGIASINVQNDTEHSVEKIKEFVDKYNEIVGTFNSKLTEKRYRDYPPLTDEQKNEMTETEIELWREKAKSGLLRSDMTLRSVLSDMRFSMSSVINTGNPDVELLSDIGITVSDDYKDNGKLEINETKLREALQENPEDVMKFFSNNTEDQSKGLINRLEDNVEKAMTSITNLAGNVGQVDEQYSMGRRIDNLNERIFDFERRLVDIESRYYRQFTAMERAIQRANTQSMYLMQQFGGA